MSSHEALRFARCHRSSASHRQALESFCLFDLISFIMYCGSFSCVANWSHAAATGTVNSINLDHCNASIRFSGEER